jgi:hypothetical protein
MSLFDKLPPSRFTEKIDVLDLLINLLREHEEKLDEYITRLEAMGLNSEGIERLIKALEPDTSSLDEDIHIGTNGTGELNHR